MREAGGGEGDRIGDPLEESKLFPPMVVHMIGVGEESGSLDFMLQKIADFYENERTYVHTVGSDVTVSTSASAGVTDGGTTITMNSTDGNIKEGDVLLKLNDTALEKREQLQDLLKEMSAGDEVKLDLLRDGKPQTLTLNLGAR